MVTTAVPHVTLDLVNNCYLSQNMIMIFMSNRKLTRSCTKST
jgi:hypothetical protein